MKRAPTDRDGTALTVLTVGTSDAQQIRPIGTNIATFLHPVQLDKFRRDFMEAGKALAVKVHPRLRDRRIAAIKKMLYGFNPKDMLDNSNSDAISVWMRTQDGILHQIKAGSPDDAKKCYEAGHSLYFRGNEELEAAFVTSYSQQLGFAFPRHRDGLRRGEIETFATQIGHETSWHWDFQENFTVQLRGTKRWSFVKSGILHPHRAYAQHFNSSENVGLLHTQRQLHCMDDASFAGLPADADDICETVTLQPGDVLYHPPGLWHKVETVAAGAEPCNSLSINVSLFPATWAEFMLENIQQQMLRSSLWRSRVMCHGHNEAQDAARAMLKKLSSDIALLQRSVNFIMPAALTTHMPTAIKIEADGDARCHGGFKISPGPKPQPLAELLFNPVGGLTKCLQEVQPQIIARIQPATKDEESQDDEEAEESDCEEATIEIEAPKDYVRFDYCANFAAEDLHANAPAIMVPFFVHPSRVADAERIIALAAKNVKAGATVTVKQLAISPQFLDALIFVGLLGYPDA